jgi:hypothetical protein
MIMCGGVLMMPGRKETKEKDADQEKEQKRKPKEDMQE